MIGCEGKFGVRFWKYEIMIFILTIEITYKNDLIRIRAEPKDSSIFTRMTGVPLRGLVCPRDKSYLKWMVWICQMLDKPLH